MLHTQVAPWMLVGDTLTDRPLNGGAGLALGYLFHDSSAGDCSIYTKNGWEPFCCGESGCSGGSTGIGILKFFGAGSIVSGGFIAPTPGPPIYFGDAVPVAGTASSATGLQYVLPVARTVEFFSVNLIAYIGEPVNVALYVNGTAVSTIAFAGTPQIQSVAGPFAIPANATVDVGAYVPGGVGVGGNVALSATIELQ